MGRVDVSLALNSSNSSVFCGRAVPHLRRTSSWTSEDICALKWRHHYLSQDLCSGCFGTFWNVWRHLRLDRKFPISCKYKACKPIKNGLYGVIFLTTLGNGCSWESERGPAWVPLRWTCSPVSEIKRITHLKKTQLWLQEWTLDRSCSAGICSCLSDGES